MYNIKIIKPFKKLNEGLDIDYINHTISYNPLHQKGVDTSVEHNPQHNKINGYDVWSIFKRKRNIRGDGNPLIYAYKHEDEWKFKSNKDRINLEWQISQILDKIFLHYYHGNVVVIAPSTSLLNTLMANIIKSKIHNVICISDLILKLTTDEAFEIATKYNSKFIQQYKNNNFNKNLKKLEKYLDEMDNKKNGYFVRHMISDPDMRNSLDQTFKLSNSMSVEYAKYINDNDVLIIDDTISRGQSIKEMCQIIKDTYNPKSLTVLTLMSTLDNKQLE